jgi:hypothetical protein
MVLAYASNTQLSEQSTIVEGIRERDAGVRTFLLCRSHASGVSADGSIVFALSDSALPDGAHCGQAIVEIYRTHTFKKLGMPNALFLHFDSWSNLAVFSILFSRGRCFTN